MAVAALAGVLLVLVPRAASRSAARRSEARAAPAERRPARPAAAAPRRGDRVPASAPAMAAPSRAAKLATRATPFGLPSASKPGLLSGLRLGELRYAGIAASQSVEVQWQTAEAAPDPGLRRPSAAEQRAVELEIYVALAGTLERLRAAPTGDRDPDLQAHLKSEEARLAGLRASLGQHGVTDAAIAAARAASAKQHEAKTAGGSAGE